MKHALSSSNNRGANFRGFTVHVSCILQQLVTLVLMLVNAVQLQMLNVETMEAEINVCVCRGLRTTDRAGIASS